MEQYGTAGQATNDNIIRRMRIVCWITKAANTHTEYVILIAFPRHQWLRERASMLRYTYIACLVITARANRGKQFLSQHSICLSLVYLYASTSRCKQCCFLQHKTINRLIM
jgi:hypothetical protein